MDRKELEIKIIEIVTMSFGKKPGEVLPSSSFRNDLGGSSIQMVGVVSEIENELDVTVPLLEAAKCTTVEELINKVESEL